MRKFALLLLASAFLVGCGNLFEPAAAVVHGTKITMDEVTDALEEFEKTEQYRRLTQQGDPSALRRQFEQGYLAQLIREKVFIPKAEELGITVTEADVQEQIDKIKERYATQSAFDEALKEQGLTMPQLVRLVRDRLMEDRLREQVTADVAPTEAELRAYYEENIHTFVATEARHILVRDKQFAQDLIDRLQSAASSEVDDLFARLAKKHSRDEQSAEEGGDLGTYNFGELVRPFERAAEKLEIGEISDPVRTEFGWHVIQVTGRRTKPFSAVSDSIEDSLSGPVQDEAWNNWVIAAYREADVEVNPRYGELDLETQQILDPSAEDLPGAEVPTPAETPTL